MTITLTTLLIWLLIAAAVGIVGEIEVGPVMIVDSIAPARIQIRLGAFASLTD